MNKMKRLHTQPKHNLVSDLVMIEYAVLSDLLKFVIAGQSQKNTTLICAAASGVLYEV